MGRKTYCKVIWTVADIEDIAEGHGLNTSKEQCKEFLKTSDGRIRGAMIRAGEEEIHCLMFDAKIDKDGNVIKWM